MNIEAARSVGQQTLGPIFTGWVHLLMRSARRQQQQKLWFIARDGSLLQRVSTCFLKSEGGNDYSGLDYLHLSRRSTLLAANTRIDAGSIEETLALRASPLTLAGLLESHGLTADRYHHVLDHIGLTPHTPVTSPQQGLKLLGAPELASLIRDEAAEQRAALLDYLVRGHDVGVVPGTLVDVGWRGSIQRKLSRLLASAPRLTPPSGCYLGLWREDGAASSLPNNANGLIGDLRRARSLRESAPWQAALLLEAICRANEGTTLSFRLVNGRGTPILASADSPAREAEMAVDSLAEAVRQGIIDHVHQHSQKDSWRNSDDEALRRDLQDRLLRLAFFPNRDEIALGERLVHTESHDFGWSSPLIMSRPVQPLRAPRRWLSGLASPWRGGYVMATGRGTAHLYRRLESLLVAVPPRFRENIRRLALRLAASPPASS